MFHINSLETALEMIEGVGEITGKNKSSKSLKNKILLEFQELKKLNNSKFKTKQKQKSLKKIFFFFF